MPTLNWDMLAPIWKWMEQDGLNPGTLQPFLHELQSPILIVGAGLGLLVPELEKQKLTVVAVDRSFAMAKEAKSYRGVRECVADGQGLPFGDHVFGSVIFPTGVFLPGQDDFSEKILQECKRVLKPEGVAIFSAFVPNEMYIKNGNELGTLEGRVQRNDRLLEIWKKGTDVESIIELIRQWKGISKPMASQIFQKHHPGMQSLQNLFNEIAKDLTNRGFDPRDYLEKAFAGPYESFEKEAFCRLLEGQDFQILSDNLAKNHPHTLVICARPPRNQ